MRRLINSPTHARVAGVAVALVCGLAVTACGSSAGLSTTSGSGAVATTNAAAGASTTSGSMQGMKMSGASAGGITPIPTQVLGSADWQHMNIKAQAMTAVPFVVDNGTTEREIKPTKATSFHLMVDLSDARTHVAIPYATVWATIKRGGKTVFDERQWPMLSEYMGPHYGNNVTLPGAGRYTLTLLVSPPVSARHIEYQHIWLTPHRVSFTFNWKPKA